MFGSLALLHPIVGLSAAPLDLDNVMPEEPPEQLCDRLAANPFMGFGPDEWGKPFQAIDPYRAIPACSEAISAIRTSAAKAAIGTCRDRRRQEGTGKVAA